MRLIQGLYSLLLYLSLAFFATANATEEKSLAGAALLNKLQAFQTQNSLTEENSAPEIHSLPFSAFFTEDASSVTFVIDMREGAYVYADSLSVTASDGRKLEISPEGTAQRHTDIQGEHTVFFDRVNLTVMHPSYSTLTLSYQGCSQDGICYPPATLTATLSHTEETAPSPSSETQGGYTPLEVSLNQKLSQSFLLGMALCFVLGMGLNLTPCVLPMLPVFSTMITSGNEKSRTGLALRSLAYSAGLSLAYMGLGLIFSLIGAQAQAFFQHPITTGIIVLVLILCALDCMGVFQGEYLSRFSATVQQNLHLSSAHSLSGAFGLGLISALIATPCTSAPLAGAALFVIQEGDLLAGAMSFFSIGIGMAFPLFLIAVFGRGLFMKAGAYSELIRRLIALPLFGAALYLILPLLGKGALKTWLLTLGAGAGTLYFCVILCQIVLLKLRYKHLKLLAYGLSSFLALSLGVITYDRIAYDAENANSSPFILLHSLDDLQDYAHDGRPLLIDFTADWCTNCKVMENEVFSLPVVQELCKSKFHCLKFDISNLQNSATIQVTEHFKLIGVPFLVVMKEDMSILRSSTGYLTESSFYSFIGDHLVSPAN